jgi:hypothetical protein
MNQQSSQRAAQKTKVEKPTFETYLAAKKGDREALRQIRRHEKVQQDQERMKVGFERQTEANLFAGAPVRDAYQMTRPVVRSVLEGFDPIENAKITVRELGKGNLPAAGVAGLGIIPFGPGRGISGGLKAARAARAALRAEKVAKAAVKAHPAEVIPDAVAEAGRLAVLDVMPDAKVVYAQQEALRKVERARRAAMTGPAFEQAGGGLAGHVAAKEALGGELPALRFDDLTGMDDTTLHALLNAVHEHTLLRPFEKTNLRDALIKMQKGGLPTPSEVRLVHKAFGADKALGLAATKRGTLEYISDIVNIPRSLMATGEFSYRLRNGLFALAMHPAGGVKTAKKAMGVTFSQPKYEALQAALHADPELQDAMERGLALTETGHHVIGREEAFASPLAEKFTGGRVSPVRAAARNFTGNAILDRAMIYKSLLEDARKTGVEIDDHFMNSAVRVANWATGRSNWGHETLEMLTNTFLFSPKLFKSRLDVLNPRFYSQLHPFVRKRVVRSLVRMVAAGTAVLAIAAKYGADVELDPRSSDWGKIRIGKTRFDIWGGNQQIARTIAQLGSQSTKSSTTEKIHHLGHGQHFDPLGRLFEGKLSPPFSFALDVKRGEMYGGRPFTWQAEAKEHLSPLLYQDVWDAWRQESAGVAGVVAGVGAFGVGANTYKSQPKETKKKEQSRSKRYTPSWEKSKSKRYTPSWER